MSWVIRGFERDGDALVREIAVDDALRVVFRRLLDVPESDPMYDSFPLDQHALERLAEMLMLEFDTTSENYFLEFDA